MNQPTITPRLKDLNPGCTDAMKMAEQELTAFFTAVTELLGSKLAELSAEYWLNELLSTEGLPTSTREWGRITLKVSRQLASRVNASSIASASQALA